jgi:hypothetical protein
MALKGEFKKEELINDQYLCDSVTDNVKPGEQRLDKATALYLADQISEECLQAEADFVFWQPDSGQQNWAYLAKSILYREDSEKSEKYLDKVCELDAETEACAISLQMQKAQVSGPFESLTGQMIELESLFSRSEFEKAKAQAKKLSAVVGLQGKALEKLMKLEWLDEKFERARGLLDSASGFVDKGTRDEMAAWICFEELQQGCQSRQPACDQLANDFEADSERSTKSIVVGLTLVQLQSCRKNLEVSPLALQQLREDKKTFASLEFLKTRAHLKEDQNKANENYKKIALSPEKSPFIRYFAALEWIKTAQDGLELEQFFEKVEARNFNAYQNFRLITVATEKALSLNHSALALKIVKQMPEYFWSRNDYQELLAMSFLATGEREQAKKALNLSAAARAPASLDKVDQLRQEMKRLKNVIGLEK